MAAVKKGISTQFQIEWVPIDSIKLWDDNPRKNDKAAEDLAVLIKAHGVRSPIVCWSENNTIYKGNTTYKACKLLGMKSVPVVFHDFPSESAAKAYGIADNKASVFASWDKDVLGRIMSTTEFKTVNKPTGFTQKEIRHIEGDSVDTKDNTFSNDLTFKIQVEVCPAHFDDVLLAIKNLAKKYDGVKVR
jgi:site-specific DNA-methyltransferase (adenine-specific)